MLGLRSTRDYLVISFAAIILSLFTASLAGAQTTPTAVVEKATMEPSVVVPAAPTTPVKEETVTSYKGYIPGRSILITSL